MGNNHDKYFGSQKRKILILGLQNSGKTTFCHLIVSNQVNRNITPTKDLNIKDVKIGDLLITFFDLAGGERQRIFWKQHFEGAQGIIFLIGANGNQTAIQNSLKELDKLMKASSLSNIPIAIGISKIDLVDQRKIQKLTQEIQKKLNPKQKKKVFTITIQNKQTSSKLLKWLLSETKPL